MAHCHLNPGMTDLIAIAFPEYSTLPQMYTNVVSWKLGWRMMATHSSLQGLRFFIDFLGVLGNLPLEPTETNRNPVFQGSTTQRLLNEAYHWDQLFDELLGCRFTSTHVEQISSEVTPCPIGSMYAIYMDIYGNIYHQYTPNVSIYIPYMDPMGVCVCMFVSRWEKHTNTSGYERVDEQLNICEPSSHFLRPWLTARTGGEVHLRLEGWWTRDASDCVSQRMVIIHRPSPSSSHHAVVLVTARFWLTLLFVFVFAVMIVEIVHISTPHWTWSWQVGGISTTVLGTFLSWL